MKKQEKKENLPTAIMNRLDLLYLNDIDEREAYATFQFIIDYIKRVTSDSNKFNYGNYNLTIQKGRISIEFDDNEIDIESSHLSSSIMISLNNSKDINSKAVIVVKDENVDYNIKNGEKIEEYLYSLEGAYLYKEVNDETLKFLGTAVDLQARVGNKGCYELTIIPTEFIKGRRGKAIKKIITVPKELEMVDVPENMMKIYNKINEEKENLLNKKDKNLKVLKKLNKKA